MSETSAQELADYLSTYFTLAREGGVTVEFWSVAWEQFRLLIAVILLGLTALGVAGIPLLFGVRGFCCWRSLWRDCAGYLALRGLVPALFLFGLAGVLLGSYPVSDGRAVSERRLGAAAAAAVGEPGTAALYLRLLGGGWGCGLRQ